jgi:hypothetical protein
MSSRRTRCVRALAGWVCGMRALRASPRLMGRALHQEGQTPLHLAASSGSPEALRALIARGAALDKPDKVPAAAAACCARSSAVS